MRHLLTSRERAIFKIKSKQVRDQYWYVLPLVTAILIIITLGQIAEDCGLTIVNPAHAETVTAYHSPSYYCNAIEAGTPVIGATHAQLKAICPNLK